MKYLKLFEEGQYGKYWLIPTDENRYYPSLKQIGCNDNYARALAFSEDGKNSRRNRFIFIGCGNKTDWGWMPFNEQTNLLEDEYYEINEYEFMGPVNIEEWELDSMKYNL